MLAPILANYYITYRCNARCSFCDIWKAQIFRNVGDARFDDVAVNLQALKELGVRFIDFTGGEPLLHTDLPKMLIQAKRSKLLTSVTTNCLLYPKRAKEIAGNVDFLHFSLDALCERRHNEIRGVRCFDRVLESLEIADRYNEAPDLLFTVTRSNWREIEALTQFAQSLKLVLIINPVFGSDASSTVSLHIIDYLDTFSSEPYVYVNRAFHRLRRNGGNNPSSPRCRAVSATVVISPDNHLLLPCFHHTKSAISIDNNLIDLRWGNLTKYYRQRQGRFDFCLGCDINCYFDPSFHYKLDVYFFESIAAKCKYWFDKSVRSKLGQRPSLENQHLLPKLIMDKVESITDG